MEKIGVAVIGCGYWGINYVRVFTELSQSRVVVVCDQRPGRLNEVEQRFSGVAVTDEIEAALRIDEVQVVVVCTEATAHYESVRQCLRARKHVLVEKPIATAVAKAEELIDLAREENLILMVGHTFLYNTGVRKMKAYIQQSELGHLYYLYARRTNLGPIRRDVNALWDLAPHDIAIFNYLLNSAPEWVSAVGGRVLHNCREDVGFISLGYPGDIIGHIHVSWADPSKVREVVVVGSDKRILFDDVNAQERVRVFEKGVTFTSAETSYDNYQLVVRDGDIISPRVEGTEPLKNQCTHFLECVMSGCSPLTSGLDGLEVVRVMEAVDRSLESNGTPVRVNREWSRLPLMGLMEVAGR